MKSASEGAFFFDELKEVIPIDKALSILSSYFGYTSFRTGQENAINNVLEGKDTLCVMPTGGGKSVCYQVPALVMEGTVLVVSPLISLMKDQVDALHQIGIPAAYINSTLSTEEYFGTMEIAAEGGYRLLYVAPERFESQSFVQQINRMKIPMIAIDEAHCISQWGHDFRPSYRMMSRVIQSFEKRPVVLALTATATPAVRDDICEQLHIESDHTVMTGFERSNLTFSVIKGQDREKFVKDYVKKNEGEAGIIYAATRKAVDQVHAMLERTGVKVARYHAGLSDVFRQTEQDRFLMDEATVMVATNAFGMGIDKSNIRYVIHYQMPKNMESYYQEAGRAGRDGLDSECTLLFSSQDVITQRFLIDQSQDSQRIPAELEKLQSMIDYCHTESCLQKFIIAYFGESEIEDCGRCANCTDTRERFEVTVEVQKVLSCVIRMGQRFGKTMIAQVLTGSRNKKVLEFGFDKLTTYGLMKERNAKDVSDFIEFIISENFLGVENGQFPIIYVTEQGKDVLTGKVKVFRKGSVETKQITKEDPLFNQLRALRMKLAQEAGVPPFVVFSDKTLRDMAAKMPVTEEAFLEVNGVGAAKLERYGEVFMEEIKSYSAELV
ncbi:DNA helicase RecQ [Sporosarcina thermotolerans]|uniref:DNA helicase RecQ n=1 Tax=Sporosarcina thermotolerans TaxID=633404 RepID=A0AAW9A9Q7_9BACL|nr:DNA helicase RecQ [Sporosarcina thermotolerans]MDW0118182.1 DNA helicase RecQ [Sporosarcina thermotolerans]WHT47664.1 DNA helicase RecQ [Sporosarcina thermotolerans]